MGRWEEEEEEEERTRRFSGDDTTVVWSVRFTKGERVNTGKVRDEEGEGRGREGKTPLQVLSYLEVDASFFVDPLPRRDAHVQPEGARGVLQRRQGALSLLYGPPGAHLLLHESVNGGHDVHAAPNVWVGLIFFIWGLEVGVGGECGGGVGVWA